MSPALDIVGEPARPVAATKSWLKEKNRAMARILYVTFHGEKHEAEVVGGSTVKDGAVDNTIPGIEADCGGACACATCHVYVDPGWVDAVGAPAAMEVEMLQFVNDRKGNSRLSCQIRVTDALDGLIVHMPSSQH